MIMEFINWKSIGKGAFSEVFLAQEKYTNEKYAVKIVELQKMNERQLKYFETEKKILRIAVQYQLKNIIKLANVMKLPDKYYIVMEYCNGGSLFECLYNYKQKYGRPFPENIVRYLMKEIIIGVKSLHDIKIIHRDLKLPNILLKYQNKSDKDNFNVLSAEIRIIDFNVSYFPYSDADPKTIVGTSPYVAVSIANIALGKNPGETYDEKVDIWSLGIICYELLFGRKLFDGKSHFEIFKKISECNINIPNTISPQARSFLDSMLKREGKDRLSCSQLLNHDFIIGNYNQNNEESQSYEELVDQFDKIFIDPKGKGKLSETRVFDEIKYVYTHPHPLSFSDYLTKPDDYGKKGWICDECKTMFAYNIANFCCKKCCYDICDNCYNKNKIDKYQIGERKKIPYHPHILVFSDVSLKGPGYANNEWKCNECGAVFTSEFPNFYCVYCSYDICDKCISAIK